MSVIRPSSPTNLQGVGKLYVQVARVPLVSTIQTVCALLWVNTVQCLVQLCQR